MAREWNNPVRQPWNGMIKNALDAVDQHNDYYFRSKNTKHLESAEYLRKYVRSLKDWIKEEEILTSTAGLEPATDRLEGGCSIQLSYVDPENALPEGGSVL